MSKSILIEPISNGFIVHFGQLGLKKIAYTDAHKLIEDLKSHLIDGACLNRENSESLKNDEN